MEQSGKALDLIEEYVRDIALPSLEQKLPQYMDIVALGLVGNGSECFGYDDLISRDHDWGIDFFVWVPEEHADKIDELVAWKERLMQENPPIFKRGQSTYGAHTSVTTVEAFVRSLIGVTGCPQDLQQWMRTPEKNLAMAVNGRIFYDGAGLFTNIRNELLEYFPEDLRLKRIATACVVAAALGQVNFMRMYKRGDVVTARLCLQDFLEQAQHLVFMLNKQYQPYYKWVYRALQELPILGQEVAKSVEKISLAPLDTMTQAQEAEQLVEELCLILEEELRAQGLSDRQDAFIQPHGESVFTRINDPMLKRFPITYEI